MDPNKTLEALRNAILAFRANGDSFNRHWDHEECLVDAAEALDEWLSKGGFLPEAWCNNRRPLAPHGTGPNVGLYEGDE